MRRAPAVEWRSPAPSRPGHHTLCHRVLPVFPVQEASASSVPSLGPACGPAAMVGGRTPCTAGDTLGAGLREGLHRQLVTTGGDRCQPVSTADGAWAHGAGPGGRGRFPGRVERTPPVCRSALCSPFLSPFGLESVTVFDPAPLWASPS